MGFNVARNYNLIFEGTAMHGAEMKIRHTPIRVTQLLRGSLKLPEFVDLLSEYLVSWNLEDEDGPIGTDVESIMNSVEESFLHLIAEEWTRAAVGISAPLPRPSTATELKELPMETMTTELPPE